VEKCIRVWNFGSVTDPSFPQSHFPLYSHWKDVSPTCTSSTSTTTSASASGSIIPEMTLRRRFDHPHAEDEEQHTVNESLSSLVVFDYLFETGPKSPLTLMD
jgi:hypothetical protein